MYMKEAERGAEILRVYKQRIEALKDEITDQNDRVVAMIFHTLVDDELRLLLQEVLVRPKTSKKCGNPYDELFAGPFGALSSYGGRIRFSRCVNLFGDKMYQDLKSIGWIRNRLAHNLLDEGADPPQRMTFTMADVAKRCNELHAIQGRRGAGKFPLNSPRHKFIDVCIIRTSQLQNQRSFARKMPPIISWAP